MVCILRVWIVFILPPVVCIVGILLLVEVIVAVVLVLVVFDFFS